MTPAILYLLKSLGTLDGDIEFRHPVEMSFANNDFVYFNFADEADSQYWLDEHDTTQAILVNRVDYSIISISMMTRKASIHDFYHKFRKRAFISWHGPHGLVMSTRWEFRDGSEVKLGGIRRLSRNIPQFVE